MWLHTPCTFIEWYPFLLTVNARKMGNVIKPCFNSVPLNICRGPGDILSSYITQSIRDISYCSRDTWYMISHCITNYSHRTPWYKVSQCKLYLYICWYGMSWSAQLWHYKIGNELIIFNRKSKSIPEFSFIKIQLHMPIHSLFFAVVWYQTLIVLPYLTND